MRYLLARAGSTVPAGFHVDERCQHGCGKPPSNAVYIPKNCAGLTCSISVHAYIHANALNLRIKKWKEYAPFYPCVCCNAASSNCDRIMKESACLTLNKTLRPCRCPTTGRGNGYQNPEHKKRALHMLNEKSQGSVWNVAFVAIAVFVGALALSGAVTADKTSTVAASMN